MNKSETIQIFALITALFPREQTYARADAVTISAWQRALEDVSYAEAEAAIQAAAFSSPFPPAISEIRQQVAKIRSPELATTADEAWGYAICAVRKYGYLKWDEAKASMPPEVAEMVERFGYRDICMTENIDVIKGQFFTAWRSFHAKKVDNAIISPSLKALTNSLHAQKIAGRSESDKQAEKVLEGSHTAQDKLQLSIPNRQSSVSRAGTRIGRV